MSPPRNHTTNVRCPHRYIFNSPMAHRMHHRPPGNCNYAGVLIIWDRIFGTYKAEDARKDLYGLARQPNPFNLLTLNVMSVVSVVLPPPSTHALSLPHTHTHMHASNRTPRRSGVRRCLVPEDVGQVLLWQHRNLHFLVLRGVCVRRKFFLHRGLRRKV